MHSDEESLPRTPPNEEEGFRLSLSTPEVNSLLLNSFQPLSSTRSPTVSSSKRNPRRMYNFLKGKCRLAYTLDPELERSFSSSESSFLADEEPCKCGCIPILKRLVGVFTDLGRHNSKTYAAHKKSYPNPKKEETAYCNLTGEKHCMYLQFTSFGEYCRSIDIPPSMLLSQVFRPNFACRTQIVQLCVHSQSFHVLLDTEFINVISFSFQIRIDGCGRIFLMCMATTFIATAAS